MKVILEGIVGSTAYNLNTAASDIDKAGVYVWPTEVILGIAKFQETVHKLKVGGDTDITMHEAGKFIRLALSANPTVTDFLWLENYTHLDEWGQLLVDNKRSFLSARVRKTYAGYAVQQIHRLVNRGGTFDPDLAKRTAKHARHCTRLVLQAEHVMKTGDVLVGLSQQQADFCREMGELAQGDYQKFAEFGLEWVGRIDGMNSILPDDPDYATAERLLLAIRRGHYGLG